ncbi:YkvA family protein [Bacillus sp. KH172YL63]|uniref:YkvA family protein n=1 Tax=Bacillus sp. KH172YL63 TaxID=2709784 RepID=UPI0013E49D8C|nr:DUF1232 domain-containing protein [Bacillus sp. KH172YL63]BCB04264.1 hypothetical protein KH172YL63_23970 [Bacillus sp. KH172YL63]
MNMMKFIKRVKFLLNIRRSVPFLVEFFRSRDVVLWKKLLSIGLVVFYFWLPLDVIPDVLVLVGIVDDLAVFGLMVQLIVKMAPLEMKERYRLT